MNRDYVLQMQNIAVMGCIQHLVQKSQENSE